MSHKVYQTKGIILSKRNFGEADSLFFIFTEKFGLIKVYAQGVRYIKSKLRYNLGLFSFGKFCVIKAKNYWKIVDAEGVEDLKNKFGSSEEIAVVAKISGFLLRMLWGEEKNDFIWQEVVLFFFQVKNGQYSKKDFFDFEILTAAKILKNLGYMEKEIVCDTSDNLNELDRKNLVFNINRAIQESML